MAYRATHEVVQRVRPLLERLATRTIDKARLLQYLSAMAGVDWGVLRLRDRVLTERGEVRMHVNVFIEDENIRRRELLNTQLPDNSEITILPSVSGG